MNLYRIKLTTLSPLHIGSGEDFVPTNYVIDDGYLYEFDEVEFFRSLPLMLQKSFTAIASQGLNGIRKFYINEKALAKEIAHSKIKVSKAIERRFNALINRDGTQNRNQLEIAKTMKNPNSNEAYIPGSSLKGVIETAIGNYIPRGSNEERQNLIISDFKMISGETNIGIAKRKHKAKEKDGKGIPINNEAVRQKSEFIGTFKSDIRGESTQLFSIAQIQSALTGFVSHADRNAYQKYSSAYTIDNKKFVFRIGKFVGASFMIPNIRPDKIPVTHSLFSMNDQDFEPYGWVLCEVISEEKYQEYIKTYTQKTEKSAERKVRKHQEYIEKREASLKQKRDEEAQRYKEEQIKLEEEQREKNRLSSLSPVDLIIEQNEIAIVIQKMQNGEIDDYETIKIELAQKVKAKLQETPKGWEKAKQKALKRKEFIQGILDM